MKSINFSLSFLIPIFYLQGCRTYVIDKTFAANQMTNLKIEKKHRTDWELTTGHSYGKTIYSNNLKYLVVKKSLTPDTIYPIDIKFFLKSGINSGYWGTSRLIFKDGYFITFNDTSLQTNPRCKFCKIHIDSIEKIVIRGPRLNKTK